MITFERSAEIIAKWEKCTPEEQACIRQQADQLLAESKSWGLFHVDDFNAFHKNSRMYAKMFSCHSYNCFGKNNLNASVSLKDILLEVESRGWPAVELAILEELRSPSVLAWDRLCQYLNKALLDPVIIGNSEILNLIDLFRQRIKNVAAGSNTTDLLFPPGWRIAEEAISNHSREAARKKNAAPRAWVLEQWKNRADPGQLKAPFARQHVPLVKKRFKVDVTADTIARDWLPKSGK